MPRIAIATRDPSKYTETFVRRHIAYLNGGDTAVIALRGGGATTGRPALDCVPVDWTPPHRLRFRPDRRLRRALRRRRRSAQIVEFLGAQDARLVLSEFGYVAIEIASAVRAARLPHYCYLRGRDGSASLRDPAYVAALADALQDAAGVVAVSAHLLHNLADRGIRPARTLVVPSGTDTDSFRPVEKDPALVLTVGRLVAKKGPGATIRAFAAGAADTPEATLLVLGDGPLLEDCRALADTLGVGDRVRFAGRVSPAQVQAAMARAAIYLQHFETAPDGDTEGMPSVLQEAMASGCAIATTRHAGIPEQVAHARTGLLSDEGDVTGLAENLGRLLEDGRLRDELGAAARSHAVRALDYRALYRGVEAFLGLRRP